MIAMARSWENTTRGTPMDVGTTGTSPNSGRISGKSSAYSGVDSEYRTAPDGAAPPIRSTESMMNSFCVMSRMSAGMTRGSFSSSLTVIRGASL